MIYGSRDSDKIITSLLAVMPSESYLEIMKRAKSFSGPIIRKKVNTFLLSTSYFCIIMLPHDMVTKYTVLVAQKPKF